MGNSARSTVVTSFLPSTTFDPLYLCTQMVERWYSSFCFAFSLIPYQYIWFGWRSSHVHEVNLSTTRLSYHWARLVAPPLPLPPDPPLQRYVEKRQQPQLSYFSCSVRNHHICRVVRHNTNWHNLPYTGHEHAPEYDQLYLRACTTPGHCLNRKETRRNEHTNVTPALYATQRMHTVNTKNCTNTHFDSVQGYTSNYSTSNGSCLKAKQADKRSTRTAHFLPLTLSPFIRSPYTAAWAFQDVSKTSWTQSTSSTLI